jgi:hypothetical protein
MPALRERVRPSDTGKTLSNTTEEFSVALLIRYPTGGNVGDGR